MANRKLIVEIVGDTRSLERSFASASRSAGGFSRRLTSSLGAVAKGGLFAASAAAVGGLAVVIHQGTKEFVEHAKVAAQTGAVLKSTGGISGVTAKQVEALALSLSNLSGIDDELVQAGENVLLSFTHIRDAAGAGNDIFTQATKAAVDFAARTGRDVPKAALLLGKALEDPANKVAALARAGIVFSKQQQNVIKAMVKSGDVMGAQKVILSELEKRYGGAAKAAGETLPGQLNVLRERFRDLAGEVVGSVAPAFAGALKSVTGFVRQLSEAQGAKAKFSIVFEGVKEIASGLFDQVRSAIAAVNWEETLAAAQTGLLNGVRALGEFVGRIDFREVGATLGRAISASFSRAAEFISTVDFREVGRKIVKGIGDFLKGVDWKAVAVGTIRLLVAAVKGTASLLLGVGEELGKALLQGIGRGLDALATAIERKALQIVLAIVKKLDFKLFGKHVVPGIGALVSGIEGKLGDLAASAEANSARINAALKGAVPTVADLNTQFIDKFKSLITFDVPKRTPSAPTATNAPVVAAQTVAKTAKVVETAAEKAQKAFDKLLDGLQLGLDKAERTPMFKDDLDAIGKIIAALRTRAAVAKGDVGVQRDLVTALEKQSQILADQKTAILAKQQASQFKALGLTATGDEVIPGVRNLRKQLASLTERLPGTVADTGKNRGMLARIRKVLTDPINTATEETRSAIRSMFQTIRGEFDKGSKQGPLTKTTSLNANKLLDGLGLGRDMEKELRARLSSFNSAGVALAGNRRPTGKFVVGGQTIVVENHNNLTLDGDVVGRNVTRSQQKTKRRNPKQKRGPNSGV